MNKITLSFAELNEDQAKLLLEAYSEIVTDGRNFAVNGGGIEPAPHDAIPTPVTVAPVTPAPTVAQDVTASVEPELDTFGVPWHADIHAATRTQKKDGSWTRRKGADKATCDAYEAEHRAAYQNAAATVTATPEASDMLPLAAPTTPAAPAAPLAIQPPQPPMLAPTTPAAPVAAVDYDSQFLPLWQALTNAGKMPMAEIDKAMQTHGAGQDFTQLHTNAALRNDLYAVLCAVQ